MIISLIHLHEEVEEATMINDDNNDNNEENNNGNSTEETETMPRECLLASVLSFKLPPRDEMQ